MSKAVEAYRRRKKEERDHIITEEICRTLHRWRKRIIKKEVIRVANRTLLYKEQFVGSFLGKDKWERRSIIETCLYTIQVIKWNDPEYHFDWEERHACTTNS